MTARPGLVASDLDGTLLRSDATVSARTRRALAAVERAGVPLVLVTGRPPRWMAPVVAQTGHRGVAVCANGAVVYDLHTERVLASLPLDPAAALAFADALARALPGVAFATEGPDGSFGHEPGYQARQPPPRVRVGPLSELLEQPVVKLLVRHPNLAADTLLEVGEAALGGGQLTLTHSNVRDSLLEVSAAGVTKASTLARLAAEAGVAAAAVLAFGDMPNDLPLLRWAGHGVAVAGAHPLLLAAADEVTAGNDEDGVAAVLERFFG